MGEEEDGEERGREFERRRAELYENAEVSKYKYAKVGQETED